MASPALGALAAFVLAAAAAPQQTQPGTFALYGGAARSVSQLSLRSGNTLDVVQFKAPGRDAITTYQPTEGEPLHVILVRDDFRTFSHVHPAQQADGHFRVSVALDGGHRYYAFVASQPQGMPPQAFRFQLQTQAPPPHLLTTLPAPRAWSQAGPYNVKLSTVRFAGGENAIVDARIWTSHGAAVRAHPYSGAAAHSVFINPETLQYVHVDATANGPDLRLHLPPLRRGAYRMWLQFSDGRAVYVAPFMLAAE